MTSLQLLIHSLEQHSSQYHCPWPSTSCSLHIVTQWHTMTSYVLFVDYSSVFNTIVPSRLVSKLRPFPRLITLASWWRRPPLPPLVAQRLSGPTQGAQELLHLPHGEHPVQENHRLGGKRHQKELLQKGLSAFCPIFPISETWICTKNFLWVFYKSRALHHPFPRTAWDQIQYIIF